MSGPRYVQRDPVTTEVIGHFAHSHSYATEAVAEDHPDLMAYRQKRIDDALAAAARKALINPEAMLVRIGQLEADRAAMLTRIADLERKVVILEGPL